MNIQARDKKIISLIKKGKTYVEIGKMFDLSKQRIHQISGANGFDDKLSDSRRKKKELYNLIKGYLEQGLSTEQIAKKLKVNRNRIYYIIKSVSGKHIIRKSKIKARKRL